MQEGRGQGGKRRRGLRKGVGIVKGKGDRERLEMGWWKMGGGGEEKKGKQVRREKWDIRVLEKKRKEGRRKDYTESMED